MKDDAVSPVVAFMLLLMVVVSFISVLNAYYIPSLKQQAEIEHLQDVEESFLKISPEVFNILAYKKSVLLKEPIQLGGGDVILSSLKSSGYLEVNTSYLGDNRLTISSTKFSDITSSINPTKIIYRPSGNFWIEQGYEWEDGVIYVKKGHNKVPLQYFENDDIEITYEKQRFYDMLMPQITLEKEEDRITSVNIYLINVISPIKSCSGNGYGTLNIDLSRPDELSYDVSYGDKINFEITQDLLLSDDITNVINKEFDDVTSGSITWEKSEDGFTMTVNEADGIKIKIKKWNLSIFVT